MGLLTREQILQADDLPREKVSVPEWGGEVYVRTLTSNERDTFEAESVTYRPKGESSPNLEALHSTRARLCARTLCDESGTRLFSDEDVLLLGAKSGAALDRVFEVSARLNKIRPEDIEELEKNSGRVRAGGSSSS